jgi:hypothetical protein
MEWQSMNGAVVQVRVLGSSRCNLTYVVHSHQGDLKFCPLYASLLQHHEPRVALHQGLDAVAIANKSWSRMLV